MDKEKTGGMREVNMSQESEEVAFDEWVKEREKVMRDQAERIESAKKPFFLPKDFVYDGFQVLCDELADLYKALLFIYEIIYENDKELAQNLKAFLGLHAKATKEDVAERAKELGRINEQFARRLEAGKKIKTKKEKKDSDQFYIR